MNERGDFKVGDYVVHVEKEYKYGIGIIIAINSDLSVVFWFNPKLGKGHYTKFLTMRLKKVF